MRDVQSMDDMRVVLGAASGGDHLRVRFRAGVGHHEIGDVIKAGASFAGEDPRMKLAEGRASVWSRSPNEREATCIVDSTHSGKLVEHVHSFEFVQAL